VKDGITAIGSVAGQISLMQVDGLGKMPTALVHGSTVTGTNKTASV
jgi:hypothetical protein